MKLTIRTALAATLFSCLMTLSVRADLIWYESFNYANGPITNAPVWVRHSGSAVPSDALVFNKRLENAATQPSGSSYVPNRQDDVNRVLTNSSAAYTNGGVTMFASFTVNCTNLPNGIGTYFAHFKDSSSSNFLVRVFGLTGSGGVGTAPTNFAALPNTWRLGISAQAGNATSVFPVDLATNADYQVVIGYDPSTKICQLWVNPMSSSDLAVDNTSNPTDVVPGSYGPISALAFRQASSFGNAFFAISNAATATTFDDAATNVWATTPVPPGVIYQPQNVTNYSGNPATFWMVADGQGLSSLAYQWLKDGSPVSNPLGNSNVFTIASLAGDGSDQGQYSVIVSNQTTSLTVTSSVAYLAVNTTLTPPTFSSVPASPQTNNSGQNITLAASAYGTGPISYSWSKDGVPLSDGAVGGSGDAAVIVGSQTSTLVIENASTNESGNYTLTVTGGVSPQATTSVSLTVLGAQSVSIAYLRSLLDPVQWQATDTTGVFNITGTITTATNLTTGTTSSYYIQDSTAGLNLFITGTSTFRPALGDIVTATGSLSSFNNNLELVCNTLNVYHSFSILSHGNPLPAPFVFDFSLTNNAGLMETNIEGRYVMLTNVYLKTTAISSSANTTITITNKSGAPLQLFFSSVDRDTAGKTAPSFAWTVTGVLYQNRSGFTYGNNAYQVIVTRMADMVAVPPAAVTAQAQLSGSSMDLTWTANPYTNSYSIFMATNLPGPFTPIAKGLVFTNTVGEFLDANPADPMRFYKISSP